MSGVMDLGPRLIDGLLTTDLSGVDDSSAIERPMRFWLEARR